MGGSIDSIPAEIGLMQGPIIKDDDMIYQSNSCVDDEDEETSTNKNINGNIITRLKRKEIMRGMQLKNMEGVNRENYIDIKNQKNTSENWPSEFNQQSLDL